LINGQLVFLLEHVCAGNIRSVCGVTLLHACFLVPSKLEAAVLEYLGIPFILFYFWIKILERAEDSIKI
jgi:hypothetical protein